MATGPKIALTPLELLNSPPAEKPLLTKIWGPVIGGTIMFCASVGANWGKRRPLFSGIQNIILLTVGGSVVGKYLDEYRDSYLADRDAMFRHYIELHPEDFPPFERKKYADILESWIPIR